MFNSLKQISPFKFIKYNFLLLLWLCNFFGYSQDFDSSVIKVDNNNFSAYLTKVLYPDYDGFLWYSTRNGIVKEMGNEKNFFFEYAFNKEKHDQVLVCYKILKSSKNKIWSCTNVGVNILDLDTGTSEWHEFNYPETSNYVMFTDIIEDKLGNIWLATDKNYIYKYNLNNEFIPFKLYGSDYNASDKKREDLARTQFTNVLEDNTIVINQYNKWFRFNNNRSSLIYTEERDSTKIHSRTIAVPNGELFSINTSGTYTYKNKPYNYTYLPEVDKQIIQSPFGNLQYIPSEAIKKFNNSITLFNNKENEFYLLTMKKIGSRYELIEEDVISYRHTISNSTYDGNGYFWIHTEEGIHKVRYKDNRFNTYLNYNDISCRGFTETKNGDLYVFTYKGIYKKEKGSDVFLEIDNIKDTQAYYKLTNGAYSFYNQNDQYFWFYGYFNSLACLNINDGTIREYKHKDDSFNVFDEAQLDDNTLFLATTEGLYSFNLNTKEYKNESILNDSIDLTNKSIKCITLSKDKTTLWISNSSKHSLIRYNLKTKETTLFNTSTPKMQLIDKNIKLIYEDQENNIWLGSNNGLQKFNPITYKQKSYNALNGITNTNIASILEEEDNFWVATFNGLIKLNKTTQKVQTYYEIDGLAHNEFNIKSYFKSLDGTFYFGGLNGITSFNPKEVSNKAKTYKIVLTDYQLYDKQKKQNVLIKAILENDITQFNIPHNQNYLTLNFRINDIYNPENNVYQYRINELSEEWIDLGNYSKIELRGLNPKRYNLEVRGYSSNGNITNTLKYVVNINQVFYKKWWFLGLSILSIFAFITVRNYKRRKRQQRQFELKSKIQALEAKAMRAQMNPHFIFNTLNGMQSVMILKGEREANKYFTSFSKLLRFTLDMSNSEYVLLKNEIKYLNSYLELENLRLDNKIKIQFNIDSNLDIEDYSIPCMLFQPIIENAIIHGLSPKKNNLKLIINFKKNKENLVGEIIDNGIGRSEAMKLNKKINSNHKSWATHIMKERIKTTNSINDEKIFWDIEDLHDEQFNASGTKVILSIPLKKVGHE